MVFIHHSAAGNSIVLCLPDFPHPCLGSKPTDRGKTVRSKNVFLTITENHDVAKQYWKLTDGKEWMAIVYDYVSKG